jgi:hypothetical protein
VISNAHSRQSGGSVKRSLVVACSTPMSDHQIAGSAVMGSVAAIFIEAWLRRTFADVPVTSTTQSGCSRMAVLAGCPELDEIRSVTAMVGSAAPSGLAARICLDIRISRQDSEAVMADCNVQRPRIG